MPCAMCYELHMPKVISKVLLMCLGERYAQHLVRLLHDHASMLSVEQQ